MFGKFLQPFFSICAHFCSNSKKNLPHPPLEIELGVFFRSLNSHYFGNCLVNHFKMYFWKFFGSSSKYFLRKTSAIWNLVKVLKILKIYYIYYRTHLVNLSHCQEFGNSLIFLKFFNICSNQAYF